MQKVATLPYFCEFDSCISQLRALGTHTLNLVFCSPRMGGYDCYQLGDADFCVTLLLVPIETFNISFESTQNKHHYGTKSTCTEVREKKVMMIRNMSKKNLCFDI